jgi:hypothetical protein
MLVFNLLVLTCMLIVVILKVRLVSETFIIASYVISVLYLWKAKEQVIIRGWKLPGWLIMLILDVAVLKGICDVVLDLLVEVINWAFLIVSDSLLYFKQLLLKIPFAVVLDVALLVVVIFRRASVSAWLFEKHRPKVPTAVSVLTAMTLQIW